MIINAQNNFLHNLVCVVLLHGHTRILLFPEVGTSLGLSQDPSDKKANY